MFTLCGRDWAGLRLGLWLFLCIADQANGTSKLSSQAPALSLLSRSQQEHDTVGQKHTSLGHQSSSRSQQEHDTVGQKHTSLGHQSRRFPAVGTKSMGSGQRENSNDLGASPRSHTVASHSPTPTPSLSYSLLVSLALYDRALSVLQIQVRRTRSSSEDQISGWIHSFRQ